MARGADRTTGADAPRSPLEGPSVIVVRGARVHVAPGRVAQHDVVVRDGLVTSLDATTHPLPAAAAVLDAPGASVLPLATDRAIRDHGGVEPLIATGHSAAFVVLAAGVEPPARRDVLVLRPADVVAVVLGDLVVAWDGAPAPAADPGPGWTGAWTDAGRRMTQHLTPGGRYSETRSGRVDAWTGRFWARDDWIAYLDDTGFWAFGIRTGDVLHHAEFVLEREPSGG